MSSNQFRDARIFSGMTRAEAASFLQVSVRTIGHWETGRARPSYAAFKLLRIYRHGDLIHPAWQAYSINRRGALVTPEGHEIASHEMTWLSLLVRRAKAFGELLRERDSGAWGQGAGKAVKLHLGAPAVRPIAVSYQVGGLFPGRSGGKWGWSIACSYGPGSNTGQKSPGVTP